MGEASRRKKATRQTRPTHPMRSLLTQFRRTTVLDVIGAAMSSPTSVHQTPALCWLLWEAASYRDLAKARNATAEDLPLLVAAAHRAEPQLAMLTDWIPVDPRLEVGVRWGNNLFRLHPGDVERPVALVRKARFVARVIDPTLLQNLGFCLADFVELSLRHSDSAMTRLSPVWSAGPVNTPDAAPTVEPAEIRAWQDVMGLDDAVVRCRYPERAGRALQWATRSANRANSGDNPVDLLSDTLQVDLPGGRAWPIPPSLVCGAIASATEHLAALAADIDPSLNERFARAAAHRVRRLIGRLGFDVAELVISDAGGKASLVFAVAGNTFLAVDVTSGLRPPKGIAESAERLIRLTSGAWQTRTGQVTVPDNARIARLAVVVVPTHSAVPSGGGVAGASLEDLEWITSELVESPDDLWWFVHDLAEQIGIRHGFLGWETINAFEHWRELGGRLLPGAVDVDGLVIDAHRGNAEFIQEAGRLPIEKALLACHLPPVEAFDEVHIENDGATLIDQGHDVVVRVVPVNPPVCITVGRGRVPADFRKFAGSVASGIAWKLNHIPAQSWIASSLGLSGIEIVLEWSVTGIKIECQQVTGRRIVLTLSEAALETCVQSATQFEADVLAAIADGLRRLGAGLRDVDIDDLQSAWTAAPPGIRTDAFSLPQVEWWPPPPQRPSVAARAMFERHLARTLRSEGIMPGQWNGTAATEFESQFANPALMTMLRGQLDRFDATALLSLAAREYDLGSAARAHAERDLSFRQRFAVFDGDPIELSRTITNEAHQRSRTHALLIEEMVSQPPTGDSVPDRIDWTEILALGALSFESGLRSETIHLGLVPSEIVVSDQYEIVVRPTNVQGLTDLRALEDGLLDESHVGPNLPWVEEGDDPGPTPADTLIRSGLQPVSEALRDSLGFDLWTLTGVLASLRAWPSLVQGRIRWAAMEDIVEFCGEQIDNATAAEVLAATKHLVLNQTVLGKGPLEHWEQERRPARLSTRPIVQRHDGLVTVMPWAVEMTLRIYARYLGDGRLPWHPSAIPPRVQTAIDRYRELRNNQLERELFGAVKDAGYRARRNIKKPRVLALEKLSGEIDVLAADEERRVPLDP